MKNVMPVSVFQLFTMDLRDLNSEVVFTSENTKSCTLLSDTTIIKIIMAIWISTSAMAILEPCLPIWLLENMHPKVGFRSKIFKIVLYNFKYILYRNGKLEPYLYRTR